ncbi:MAG: hypothetical protein ACREL7_13275 [Longimicrobiales bacterium]
MIGAFGGSDRTIRHAVVLAGAILGLFVLFPAGPGAAQQEDGWNGARALQLMDMARERRAQPLADSTLQNYRATAEGVVYFYLDRRDADERVLVRTDQVAVEVFWAQPDLTKQRIVGLRDRSALPNRMYYHLDHLTVVQNGFGDVMRMGDGDEVADVPHPAAPGSDSIYDFRLTDSLSMRLPGRPTPIKAYRIDVRPVHMDRSAIIGSVYVDHETGDIVRMTFTFTPVSYVDRRLERINVSLDNGLWQGRYWLPNEQSVEIRRQIPELDFVATSVIQGRFQIRDYEFNLELPEQLFWGYRVVTVPREQREAYPFDRGIYEDLHEAGLAPPPEMDVLRARAATLVRQRVLSGLPRLRLSLPNASQVLHFDRATGLHLGAGASYAVSTSTRLESTFGFAFGAEQPALSIGLRKQVGDATLVRTRAYLNATRDLGVRPGAPGALNTFSALAGTDFLDPYWASGFSVDITHPLNPTWELGVRARIEEHESAALARLDAPLGDASFRAVRPIDEGTLGGASIFVERTDHERSGWSWQTRATLDVASLEGNLFVAPRIDAALHRGNATRATEFDVRVGAGFAASSPPAQAHALAGGRNTIPGYAYRSFAGDAFVVADAEASRDVHAPWIRARLLAAAGWVGDVGPTARTLDGGLAGSDRVRDLWTARPTGGIRTSIGAGISLGWDILRFDVVRGLSRDGEWQFLFSIQPRLWGVL